MERRKGGPVGATDELALFAELGAAFAGFIAIFLIFARREGRFSPADSLRIRSIILASFSAVFISLVPLVLHHAGFSGVALWRVASTVALIGGLLAGGVVARKHVTLAPTDRANVGVLHSVITWGLFAIAAIFLVSNAFWLVSTPLRRALPRVIGLHPRHCRNELRHDRFPASAVTGQL
jgi:hypothetical protein